MNKTNMFAEANDPGMRAYKTADTTNEAGHPAWKRPLEERTIQLLTTNTLDNTFYADQETIAKETGETYRAMLAKDPEFFAKAIVYARNEGCMRLQPIVGLVFLSTLPKDEARLFDAAFRQVIQTPHDLQSFIEWAENSGIRKSAGRRIKRNVCAWLNRMSEYHAIKYPLSGKGFSLRDIVCLFRPKPISLKQGLLFKWIVKGEYGGEGTVLRQVHAYEQLKRATKPAEVRRLIEEGRLPHEVATGVVKPDAETWAFIMRQMPHFAMLRNLNTLDRAGVFSNPENVRHAVSVLANREAVLKSKVLPFQYHEAFKAYEGANSDIRDAIVSALELSFENLPEIPGDVVIAPDVSGSMSNTLSSGKSKATYSDIAGIFSAALFRKSPTCTILPFGDRVVTDFRASRHDSIMTTAKAFHHRNMGTDVGAPIRYANQNGLRMDVFIGITDNMEWYTQHAGWGGQSTGFYGEWTKRTNKNAKAFLVRIDPYQGAAAPPADSNCHLIYGWNAKVLDYIALTMRGAGGQVEAVRQVNLMVQR